MKDWQRFRLIAWIVEKVIDVTEMIIDAVSDRKKEREVKDTFEREEKERWIDNG